MKSRVLLAILVAWSLMVIAALRLLLGNVTLWPEVLS